MSELGYQDVVEVLKKKLAGYKIKTELSENSDVLALGIDSLDIMDYLFFIEEKYGINIPDEFIENNSLLVIKETANYILGKLGQ